jgi:hypothetical protein
MEEGRSGQDFMDLLNEEAHLNATVDFTFNYHYIGSGDWGNYTDYEVAVSDTKREAIPEKQAMLASESISVPNTNISASQDTAQKTESISIPVSTIVRSKRPLTPV